MVDGDVGIMAVVTAILVKTWTRSCDGQASGSAKSSLISWHPNYLQKPIIGYAVWQELGARATQADHRRICRENKCEFPSLGIT